MTDLYHDIKELILNHDQNERILLTWEWQSGPMGLSDIPI